MENANIVSKIESNTSLVSSEFMDEVIGLFKTINVNLTRTDIEEFLRYRTIEETKNITIGQLKNMTLAEFYYEKII